MIKIVTMVMVMILFQKVSLLNVLYVCKMTTVDKHIPFK